MFESGKILQERYQIQQKLGQAIAGRQTWLATDLATKPNELVIIKLLAFSSEIQWDDLKLFEREAKVLQNLNHPRIPRYRNYFLVDKQSGSELSWWGLVQDYIPGATLQELLEQSKKFSEQKLRTIAEEVLQILAYLHELNPPVIHRDIKPSNLIWGQDQQIYLVDFGAVQERVAVTGMTFTVVGTSGYAPLEQFWGRAVPASDIYALGATLIHLLTGISPAELPQSNLQIQFSARTNLSPTFVSWIEKLTAPALEQRFATAHQALESLKHEVISNSEIAHPSSLPQTVCANATKGLQGCHTFLVVENSAKKLEIHKHQVALDFSIYKFYAIFLAFLMSIGAGTIVAVLLLGLSLGFVLVGLCFLFGSVIDLIKNRHRDKTRGCFIRFDAERNYFQFSNYWYAFNSRWGEGIISDIRYISIDETVHSGYPYSSSFSTWNVIIRADRSYILNWKLSEEECIWLVHEIQTWLNSVKLKLSY